jgi:hypothetical protein
MTLSFAKFTWQPESDDLGSPDQSTWTPLDGDWAKGAVSVNTDVTNDYDQCESDSSTNNVQITYMCNHGDDSITVTTEPDSSDKGACVFAMTVDSSVVCGTSGRSNKGGLSGGWIFVIILVVVSFVYFVGGMALNRFKNGKSGAEMIPNITFWRDLPGLVKDGCSYFVAKVKGLCGVKSSASGGSSSYDEI